MTEMSRGKSRNKVSVGEPAEGSLQCPSFFFFFPPGFLLRAGSGPPEKERERERERRLLRRRAETLPSSRRRRWADVWPSESRATGGRWSWAVRRRRPSTTTTRRRTRKSGLTSEREFGPSPRLSPRPPVRRRASGVAALFFGRSSPSSSGLPPGPPQGVARRVGMPAVGTTVPSSAAGHTHKRHTTSNGGPLGSCFDEERRELRYLV